jgi:hypothetical protein
MGLTEPGRNRRNSKAPSFQKNNKQSATPREMILSHLKYFLLLRSKGKRDKGSIVPISNVQTVKELLDMAQLKRDENSLLTYVSRATSP